MVILSVDRSDKPLPKEQDTKARSLVFDVFLHTEDVGRFKSFLDDPRNRGGIDIYSKTTTNKGSDTLLHAIDAIRKGKIYQNENPNLWVTQIKDAPGGLTFQLGDLKFENFPKAPEFPRIFDLCDEAQKCGIKTNVAGIGPFRDSDQRWFSIGSLVFDMAKSNQAKFNKDELAFLHLACFVWGSLGYEKTLLSNFEYWGGHHSIEEIAKQVSNFAYVYPKSATPIGNAFI